MTVLPLYFWHIPKTAGTSFIQWLDSHHEPDDVFAPQLLPQLEATRDEDLRGRLLYRGHLADELSRRLAGPTVDITLLRNPRARTVSHLCHIWRAPEHYLHDRLHRIGNDLAAVVQDPVLRLALTDVQARYLATSTADTRDTRLPEEATGFFLAQARYELAALPSKPVLVHRATQRLRRMADFGFAEELDALAQRVANRRGWPPATAMPRSNVRPAGAPWELPALTPGDLRALDSLNRADSALYQAARRLVQLRAVRSTPARIPFPRRGERATAPV
ncbi:hypothetical protein [Modestobacter sp. VKM Ac-2985]|uniref:hypothetical protein n=1 Tax=Modestobacter sp. VKM Ac-2985 TaxID=3004139 RepID=UPI0022ABB7E7|nr:hypothetical protein [Modestobacter sp. VKM Ac-2985]MCZ2838602.1 hypothetical protein [Modestobacter sp. VKM Ac-2985]